MRKSAGYLFRRFFRRGQTWNTALYTASPGPLTEPAQWSPLRMFSARNLRVNRHHRHTLADPFLLVWQGALFLFMEEEREFRPGRIIAWRTTDLKAWESLGVVLEEAFHLSFPQVLELDGQAWMVPESGPEGVRLYRGEADLKNWKLERQLLQGHYYDPVLICENGIWMLFVSTPDHHLHLFTAPQLHGPYKQHPASPVVSGATYARGGGRIFRDAGRLIRPAQDGSHRYGEKLHLMEIRTLNEQAYAEIPLMKDLLPRDAVWNCLGGHHLDHVDVFGKKVIAIDGLGHDLWLNNLPRIVYRT